MSLLGTTKVITGLDDIPLVDTPVTYLTWTRGGRVEEVRHEPRASLFKAETRTAFRPTTLMLCNAYGEPFVETGRLVAVTITPHARYPSDWTLRITIVKPGKRNSVDYPRGFPDDAVVLMWGTHDISLADLPPLTTPMRWHCPSFASAWREVSRRCQATGQVWLDTTAAAIESHSARRNAQLAG